MTYSESAVHFGDKGSRFGVLTLPAKPRPGMPAVIIPNTGLEHRVGPNRMHVELARGLAEAGLNVLRFDIGGLGDSPVSDHTYVDAVSDQRLAMDYMEGRNLGSKFVGIGLCSGAHDVHQIARVDDRIAGAVFLDGYAYRTPKFWLRYAADRMTSVKRYGNAARRIARRFTKEPEPVSLNNVESKEIDYFISPPPETMAADLQAFMRRKMSLCYIYTGQAQYEYNYREQLLDAFPFLRRYDRLSLELMVTADHTFTRRAMREELTRMMRNWVVDKPGSLR